MKVIGLDENQRYIAVVSHTELEQVADKYFGKLEKLKIGAEFDLGGGYRFRGDIQSACAGMTSAVKNFEAARSTLLKFAAMVAQQPSQESEVP